MKFSKLVLLAGLALATPLAYQGCATAPDQRVQAVQTLGTVGASAKAAMDTATQLLKVNQITVAQWQSIANFYDTKFQPSYNLAVAAVQANLSSIASPDVINLSAQFLALVAQLTGK